MPRSERLYLADIIEAAEALERFVAERTYEEFLLDDLLQSGVLNKLTVIGEAAAHLSQDLRFRYSAVEWSDIIAFRNFAVHAYFSVDWAITWNAATENTPDLVEIIRAILATEYPPSEEE
jgi:uncharacterized protein with HEPN domain